MDAAEIEELRGFVEYCKKNPSVLHTPSFAFFKNYLERLGARIPAFGEWSTDGDEHEDKKSFASKNPDVSMDDVDIVESDIELDDSEVMKPDIDPPQKMGDPSAEVTEENQEAAQLLKAKAMEAVADCKFSEAIDHLTEAIMLNPKSTILYAHRASVFIKLKKPNAAIRDADAALEINPDSAKGYKARGMARAMLGFWETAAHDLRVASKLDFDEEIGLMLKKVEPNANKIEEHQRKYQRLRSEKKVKRAELEKKRRRDAEAAEAASLLKDGEVIAIHSGGELKEKINAASKASRLTVIYFTATWCGPCRYISPVFTSLATKFPKAVFLKVDVDGARGAAVEWKLSSIPTFVFVKNGKEIDQFVGTDKNALEQKIALHAR